jgi:ATP-dependent helicase HrpB
VPAAALCAALVSGRDLLVRLSRDDKHIAEARELFEGSADSDFYTLMRAYQFAKNNGFNPESCRRYGIHAQTARQIEQTFDQLLQIAKQQRLISNEPIAAEPVKSQETASGDPLLRCIMAGFIDQLCVRRSQGTLDCEMTEQRQGTLLRESVVQIANLFVAASIREVPSRTSEKLTLLGLASVVKREWIEEMFPEQLNARVEHLYDRTHKRVAAVKLIRFRDLVIHHEHQRDVEPTASGRCLAEAWQKGYFELPLFNHDLKQFVARVNCVATVMPELDFPRFDEAGLLEAAARAFAGLSLAKEAQAAPIKDGFLAHLAPEQRVWLNEIAPSAIAWIEGRTLKLQYPENPLDEDGEPASPEAQVKIQECFQIKEHPHICEGKLPVKLWLCTPDGKRLEATYNWPAFRSVTYPKLRAQLQKKFSSLLWP